MRNLNLMNKRLGDGELNLLLRKSEKDSKLNLKQVEPNYKDKALKQKIENFLFQAW